MNTNKNSKTENYDDLLFTHLIDGIKEYAIFMVTLEGKMGTWNPGVKRLLGYDEAEFLKLTFFEIFTPEDNLQGASQKELNGAKAEGKANDERWHLKKDGSTFWANGLLTAMKNEAGEVIGFAKIMRDQTEKKVFDEKLLKYTNSLALANKELSNFAGVVSHDLNAPLQTVYGFANILKEKASVDPEIEESVQFIVEGAERMINLVQEILEYATASDQEDEKYAFESEEVLTKTLNDLHSVIKNSGAQISHGLMPVVWADQTQLGRVFQNLIENAIKYSKPGSIPEISINAEHKDDEILFSISDNGSGIHQEDIQSIFTLFSRANTDESLSGRGIGLATCKKIVEKWGGKIWAISPPNAGSIFYFSIPNAPDQHFFGEVNSQDTLYGLIN